MRSRTTRVCGCALLILALCALASVVGFGGCGPSAPRTARLYDAEVSRCEGNERAIVASCATRSECLEQIGAERARCTAALRWICNANRRAQGVCDGNR